MDPHIRFTEISLGAPIDMDELTIILERKVHVFCDNANSICRIYSFPDLGRVILYSTGFGISIGKNSGHLARLILDWARPMLSSKE